MLAPSPTAAPQYSKSCDDAIVYLIDQASNYSLPYDARKVAREALHFLGYKITDYTQLVEDAYEKYVGNYIKVNLNPAIKAYHDLVLDSLGPSPAEIFPQLVFSSACFNALYDHTYGVLLTVDATYRVQGRWIRHELNVPEYWCELRHSNYKRVNN